MSNVKCQMSGYTLLEVLIASAIFVGVLMIATSSFTTASRLRERTLDQQQTTETARFIAETLARDIRSATGKLAINGYCPAPYQFVQGSSIQGCLADHPIPTNGLLTATSLATFRFDPTLGINGAGGMVERLYEFKADTGQLTVRKDGGDPQSLVPDGFTVKDVQFQGLSHTVVGLRSQPFVHFQLTVVSTATGNTQTIRTAVTSRQTQ